MVPTRDRTIVEQSKNYRYSINHQVVIDADFQLVVAIGRPLPGNRNDCKAWELSGAKAAVGRATVIADGGYRGSGCSFRTAVNAARPNCQCGERSTTPPTARSGDRVEHVFARVKASERRRRSHRHARHRPAVQPSPRG
ncbi:transposase [Streptomyces sp. NPDC021212]|uniref:transposase n=1 Tax=Streptomyces sp. NPDC021212 TaxID=3365118 RepID=UPI0037B37CBA